MATSVVRVIGGILAGIAMIVALWAIAGNHPRLVCALALGAFGAGWGWFLFRSFKTASVTVRSGRYLRSESPVAYWGWLAFYILAGPYLLVGGSYALVASR